METSMKAVKMLIVALPDHAKTIGALAFDNSLEFHFKEVDWPPLAPTPIPPALDLPATPVEPVVITPIVQQFLKRAAKREPAKWLKVIAPKIIEAIKASPERPVHYKALAHIAVAFGYANTSITPMLSYMKRNGILTSPKRGYYDVPPGL